MIQKPNSKTLLTLFIIIALSVPALSQDCNTGSTCIACPDNCEVCDTTVGSTCDTCAIKYFVDPDTSLCTDCPTKCLYCNSLYECTECTPGYETSTDENGYQICVFYWWKWFLIIFGSILGLALIILVIYFIRKKLKDEDTKHKEIEYQMKLQTTQPNLS